MAGVPRHGALRPCLLHAVTTLVSRSECPAGAGQRYRYRVPLPGRSLGPPRPGQCQRSPAGPAAVGPASPHNTVSVLSWTRRLQVSRSVGQGGSRFPNTNTVDVLPGELEKGSRCAGDNGPVYQLL